MKCHCMEAAYTTCATLKSIRVAEQENMDGGPCLNNPIFVVQEATAKLKRDNQRMVSSEAQAVSTI